MTGSRCAHALQLAYEAYLDSLSAAEAESLREEDEQGSHESESEHSSVGLADLKQFFSRLDSVLQETKLRLYNMLV